MLVYGNKATSIGQKNFFELKCGNCGKSGGVDIHFYSRHFHLFWIPVFPYKKEAVSHCSNCEHTRQEHQFDDMLKQRYQESKGEFKAPLWKWIGLVLIAVFIGSIIVSIQNDNKRYTSLLNDPKAGDIYLYKLGDKEYTHYKVAAVTKDSVEIFLSIYQFKGQGYKIEEDFSEKDFFDTTATYILSRKDLINKFDSGKIEKVIR